VRAQTETVLPQRDQWTARAQNNICGSQPCTSPPRLFGREIENHRAASGSYHPFARGQDGSVSGTSVGLVVTLRHGRIELILVVPQLDPLAVMVDVCHRRSRKPPPLAASGSAYGTGRRLPLAVMGR